MSSVQREDDDSTLDDYVCCLACVDCILPDQCVEIYCCPCIVLGAIVDFFKPKTQ